jgi:hypothetical protein
MDDDVLSLCSLLYDLSTLNNELASPVSRRDALDTELASQAQNCVKYSGPPRGPVYRTGGIMVIYMMVKVKCVRNHFATVVGAEVPIRDRRLWLPASSLGL